MPCHPSVIRFINATMAVNRDLNAGRIAEFGSFTCGGHDPRPLFPQADEYIGIDWRDKPGVDVVSLCHEADVGPVDVALSLQSLEHDPYWRESLDRAVWHLREGGLILASCAGPKCPVHGLDMSPKGDEYYENRTIEDVHDQVILSAALHHLPVIRSSMQYDHTSQHWSRVLVWARLGPAS